MASVVLLHAGMTHLGRVQSILDLLSAAHRVRIALDDACAFDEYAFHEILVLRTLAMSGGAMSGVELSRALGWSGGRVSTVTKALLAAGKIARARHPNRRCRAVALTQAGAAELKSADAIVDQVAKPALAALSEVELATLGGLLGRVTEAASALWRRRPADAID